jgi:protein-S-isoprenylcysteine O-methyltransferase Ste14
VIGVVVLWLAQPTAMTLLTGGAIAGVGEMLRIWAAGHLNKAREVTSSGPYRWLAHPLYTGSSLMGAGLAIASGSFVAAALVAAYLVVTLTAAVRTEEDLLRRQFGESYDRYRNPVRDVADQPVAGTKGNARRFSAARAIENREHRSVAGLTVVVLLLLLKATYNGPFW